MNPSEMIEYSNIFLAVLVRSLVFINHLSYAVIQILMTKTVHVASYDGYFICNLSEL